MPLAAALGICCGFSQPNDFCKKSSARWAEQLPGKRGLVGWIGDEETASGSFDSPKGGEQKTVLDFLLNFCINMKKHPVAVSIAKRRIEWK